MQRYSWTVLAVALLAATDSEAQQPLSAPQLDTAINLAAASASAMAQISQIRPAAAVQQMTVESRAIDAMASSFRDWPAAPARDLAIAQQKGSGAVRLPPMSRPQMLDLVSSIAPNR